MRILILDDSQERLNLFVKNFKGIYPNAEVFLTTTAKECINYLSEKTVWDLVCLDHDLGDEYYVDPTDSNTGSEVVRWLSANELLTPKPKFIVHSFNHIQAPRMVYDLKLTGYEAHYMPGVWLDNIFKETFG